MDVRGKKNASAAVNAASKGKVRVTGKNGAKAAARTGRRAAACPQASAASEAGVERNGGSGDQIQDAAGDRMQHAAEDGKDAVAETSDEGSSSDVVDLPARRTRLRSPKKSTCSAPPAQPMQPSAAQASPADPLSTAAMLSTAAIEGELPDELREEFATLPLRQQIFVTEYLSNGCNAARAARAAGYSETSATHHAARIARNQKISRILSEQAGRSMARCEITAERVLDEMAKLAFFDPRRIFDANGGLLPPSQMGDEEAAAIAGLDLRQMQDGSEMKKIKLADKAKALEMLGRYLRLFTERVEHTGSLGVQLIHDVPRPEREGA